MDKKKDSIVYEWQIKHIAITRICVFVFFDQFKSKLTNVVQTCSELANVAVEKTVRGDISK